MVCLTRILLIGLFLHASTGLLQSRNHACDPAGSAWTPYTGWRVQQDVRISPTAVPITRSTVLIYCTHGRVKHEQLLLRSDDPLAVPWNQTLPGGARLVRRRRFAQRTSNVYFPHTTVGGLYNCSMSACQPLLPLVSDKTYDGWTALHRDGLHIRTPLFYTPDILDRHYPRTSRWSRFLSSSEQYPAPTSPPKIYQLLDSIADLSLPTSAFKSALAYLNALNESL